MAKISNFRRVSKEDYSQEDQEVAERLAFNLNPFMQEVTDVINGGLDFENLKANIFTISISVDVNGKPIGTDQFNTQGIENSQGMQVISARNQTNLASYVDGQPFISFTPQGNSIVKIHKISNLTANNTYLLNIIVY